MKVSSPVGDFPFELTRMRIRGHKLVIEGSMGAWPAQIEVHARDIAQLARMVPPPVWVIGALATLALVGLRSRARDR
jgi:hypothetical protein